MDAEQPLGDTIFNRLYKIKSSPNILSPFRRRDPRDSSQKEYDSHCTFRPVINGESPFISERTIRSVKSKGECSVQPTPIQRNGENSIAYQYRRLKRIKESYHNSQISSGFYTKDQGFIPGPPVEVGLPLFYFNPAYPPPFSLGYCTTSSYVGEDVGLTSTKDVKSHLGTQAVTLKTAQSNELVPPPLPPWALGPRNASEGASNAQPKKISIVITKKEKKDEVPAAAEGGWKALLAELQKRTSGLSTALKKPVEVKAAPVPQKKKKTKKKQEFKDVMEEMKYKLAKRNGEIVEEDDDEEEEGVPEAKAPPPPPPPPQAPSNSIEPAEGKERLAITVDSNDFTLGDKGDAFSASTDSVSGPLSSTSSKAKKVFSKPDLSSILAKMKPPPAEVAAKAAAPAAEEKQAEDAPVKNNAAAALNKLFASRAPPPAAVAAAAPPPEPKPTAAQVLSAPKVASSPPPPPPVPTSWPPLPVIVADLPQKQPPSVSDATQQKSETISQSQVVPPKARSSQSSTTVVQNSLPEGYYLAQPEEDMVEPGLYTRAGWTTQELCSSMQRSSGQLQNRSSDGPDLIGIEVVRNPSLPANLNPSHALPDLELGVAYDGFELQHKQLAISDLPLPGNFYHSVEHIRKGKEFRLAQQEKLRQLELRNFLSDPIPKLNSAKESAKPATARSTTPSQFVSHVDLHYENKPFSFRKPVESSNRSDLSDGPPMGGGKRTNLVGNMYTPSGEAISSVAPTTVAWMNDLRGTSTSSHTPSSTRMKKENSRSTRNFNDITESVLPDDNASTRNAINYFAKASRREMNNYSSSNSAYTDNNNNNNSSRPSGKKLLVDDLIDRRNLIREERKKLEADAEAERIKAEKLRKALLKDRALRNTHTKPQLQYLTEGISPIMSNFGAATDHSRNSSVSNSSNNHQRFAYHKKMIDKYKNVTGSVDLERMAASAYTEYSHKHLNKKNDYIYSATPTIRNRPGPTAADVYRDLEREFEEYDDENINTFKFIDR